MVDSNSITERWLSKEVEFMKGEAMKDGTQAWIITGVWVSLFVEELHSTMTPKHIHRV